jgi:peptide chain release factor 3
LLKGLQELGEEGAIQVFENLASGALLLGAVGNLQFEVVAQRLQTEYKVDAIFESADIYTARWLTFPDEVHATQFRARATAPTGQGCGRQSGLPGEHALQPRSDEREVGPGRFP